MDYLPRHFPDSSLLRKFVKERFGARVILAFSGGKDALSAWLALRDDGFEVVPYFMYLIPGLSFIEESISKAGCGLSSEYEMFGRSFDGIDARFLQPMRERYPEDYQRVLDWFPLADLDLYRRGDL